MLVAAYTLWSSEGSLSLTALSHLLSFDSLGALVCVAVDVLSNFEVWNRSSIRHPFGLERADVLAGFANSVLLLFMGLDLISHNLQHFLEGVGSHEPHVQHAHKRISPGSVDLASLLAIVSTLISALGLKNHARIGRALRLSYMESLPSLLKNPSHFLTLSCSALLLLLPLLSIELYTPLDRLLSSTVAVLMCALGIRLVKALGSMLLMSYPHSSATKPTQPTISASSTPSQSDVQRVIHEISQDSIVTAIDEARFWQVHYGLCMANLRLRVSGSEEAANRLKERIAALVRNSLGGGYGGGGHGSGVRWEVSCQVGFER